MNNRGFICEKTGTKMIAIREEDLDTLLMDLEETAVMVQGLAALIEKEEKLKQRHRPYLDVRKEMLETAGDYLERIEEMDDALAGMPYGCDLECFQKSQPDFSDFEFPEDEEDEYDSKTELELEPENDQEDDEEMESIVMMEAILELLDDLMVLTEYLDIQRHFVMMAQHEIPVEDSWKKFDGAMLSDLTRILERWETYTGEKLAGFCI
jgi:hypothetical protein